MKEDDRIRHAALHQRIQSAIKNGLWTEAEELSYDLATLVEKLYGSHSHETASVYLDLALTLEAQGKDGSSFRYLAKIIGESSQD